jgi:heme-degrading monooxygenase HmoA
MIVRIVRMEFVPEKVNEFIELFTGTRHKIASFEGCKGVQLLNDIQAGNVFFTHSLWETEDALEKYRRSDLFKDTWTKTKAMFGGKPEAWSLKNVEIKN